LASVIQARIVSIDLVERSNEKSLPSKLEGLGLKLKPPQANQTAQMEQTTNETWLPENLQATLQKISEIGGKIWKYDAPLLAKYVEDMKIRVVKQSLLPETVVIAQVSLKTNNLTLPLNNNEFWPLSCAMMDLANDLGGVSGKILGGWKPATPYVADFSVLMEKDEFQKLYDIGIEIARALYLQELEIPQDRMRELSKKFRENEPVDFSKQNMNLDPHSFLISSGNLAYIFGLTSQPALARNRMVYMITLTYEKSLIEYRPPIFEGGMGSLQSYHIFHWGGSEPILPLIAVLVWTQFLEVQCSKFDEELKQLRGETREESDMEDLLTKLSEIGIRIASLFGEIDRVRVSLKQTLSLLERGKETFSQEVGILPGEDFLGENKSLADAGYLKTLGQEVNTSLSFIASRLRGQERQVRLLQSHVSDMVNLKTAHANVKLSSRVGTLTWVLVGLTALLVVLAALGLFKM
jgi:hypothetical protein